MRTVRYKAGWRFFKTRGLGKERKKERKKQDRKKNERTTEGVSYIGVTSLTVEVRERNERKRERKKQETKKKERTKGRQRENEKNEESEDKKPRHTTEALCPKWLNQTLVGCLNVQLN